MMIKLTFADGFQMEITQERYECMMALYDNGIFKRDSLNRLTDLEFEQTLESELNKQRTIDCLNEALKGISPEDLKDAYKEVMTICNKTQ